jgi:hypothetical protein
VVEDAADDAGLGDEGDQAHRALSFPRTTLEQAP